jgi:hypothetical protein
MSGFDLAILGDGTMPPMMEGGIRTVVLPPAMAFGEAGDGCLYGLADSCRIPPNSDVSLPIAPVGRRGAVLQGGSMAMAWGAAATPLYALFPQQ